MNKAKKRRTMKKVKPKAVTDRQMREAYKVFGDYELDAPLPPLRRSRKPLTKLRSDDER